MAPSVFLAKKSGSWNVIKIADDIQELKLLAKKAIEADGVIDDTPYDAILILSRYGIEKRKQFRDGASSAEVTGPAEVPKKEKKAPAKKKKEDGSDE